VVAGHSLGGAVASRQTDQAAGLILLGAYPIDDISSADVPVLSVSGSNDLLSTPEDIEASRENLPDDTEFVVIEGGVHAFFGDYGPQAGDGQPTTTREQAQQQTQQAMIDFLNALPES
jgi:dienelactone hydrolase